MKRLLAYAVTILLLGTFLFIYADRPRVAVMDFDFGAIHNWWWGDYDIGKGIQALVENELVNSGAVRVFSRKYLQKIIEEQNFQVSDRADPTTAVQIGKLAGVDYIIVGTVTKFEQKKKGGGLGILTRKLGLGGGAKIYEAKVALTAQLISVKTGEILASVKGEGKDVGIGIGAGGYAGGGALGFFGQDNSISKATEKAVKDVVEKLLNRIRVPQTEEEK